MYKKVAKKCRCCTICLTGVWVMLQGWQGSLCFHFWKSEKCMKIHFWKSEFLRIFAF